MTSLTVGIDEVATETQITEGWSFFMLPTQAVADFTTASDAIIAKAKIPAFHGKKFKMRDADSYLEFLRLLRRQLENPAPSLLLCSFMNESWKRTFVPFAKRILNEALAGAGLHDPAVQKLLEKFVPPLFTFQRLTKDASQPASVRIEIDADSIKKAFPEARVAVRNTTVHVGVPFRGFYNGYRKRFFENSPELERTGVAVVDDNKSFLIQAADVFGNFTLATLFVKLGVASKPRLKKSEILDDAFGNILEPTDYSARCQLQGTELELLHDGTLNARISSGL